MKKIIIINIFITTLTVFAEDSKGPQLLEFDGSSLEGKEMRPSVELVVDPGEVIGAAVFIEQLDVKKNAERSISSSLLEEIK